jgi:hypothetical protein
MHEADWTAREVCDRAGAVVVSVDYRLAATACTTQCPHDDVVAAVAWVRDTADELGIDPARISVGGASAGANLTTGAALKLRRPGRMGTRGSGARLRRLPPRDSDRVGLAGAVTCRAADAPPGAVGDHTLTVNYLGGPLSSADGYAMPALAVSRACARRCSFTLSTTDLRASGEAFAAQWQSLVSTSARCWSVACCTASQPARPLEPVGRSLDLIADVVARAHAVPETVAVKAHASAATERM